MGSFTNRSVLVTGASEGIGRALSLELARDAGCLTLTARNVERLASLESECQALGARTCLVAADLTQTEAGAEVVAKAIAQFGRLDAVVANAGATMWSRFDALQTLQPFETLMRVNFFANVWLTAAALPHLKNSRGLLVAISSVAGLTGVPERTAYCASKHALVGFCNSLRIELAGSGVDVTVIAPDFVLTETHRRALGADGRALGESPMRESRIMTAERCAQRIRRAMERRSRLEITSVRGRWGRVLQIVAPALIDRIAARAIRERH